MPTTLPIRSPDCAYGRTRGISNTTAIVLLWAIAMIALTAPVGTAHTAHLDMSGMVSP